jgi:catechol 2,3-dioxygenase-like lactoylglutathione lyase family enzyme
MSQLRLNHVSVTCADLERSLAFYRDLLGLTVLDQGEVDFKASPAHREIIGLGDVRLRCAEIALGEHAFLELFEYLEPRGKPVCSRTCDPGDTHFALTVDTDIEGLHDRLTAAGVPTRSRPTTLTGGEWVGAKAFYASDPDGVTVEFIEFPGGDRV